MKLRLLNLLFVLIGLTLSTVIAPRPVLANDNCCGFNGQNCSSDQEWQNGWNACNNNACPGYAGCAKGSGGSGGSTPAPSQGSSGSNICGAGGAQGCAGKPVGYIMNVGIERLRCFKQTPQSTSCGRQYVDSNGNYTSGSDNSSAGSGNSSSGSGSGTGTSTPTATRCTDGSADHCMGEIYNTVKTIPGSSTLIRCEKRQDSTRCKRTIVEDNATPDQISESLPTTGQACSGANSKCRNANDTCRQNNGQGAFRCLPSNTEGIPPTITAFRLLQGADAINLVCQAETSCSGNNCYTTKAACETELASRKKQIQFERSCTASKGKILTCSNGQHCVDARLSTTCAEFEQSNKLPTTPPEEMKKICQQAGAERLEECRVVIQENGACGGSGQVCAMGLECLIISGQAPNRSCRKPLQLPDGNQIITVYSNETGACVSKQIRRSEAAWDTVHFENPANCARSLNSLPQRYKLSQGSNNSQPTCSSQTTPCGPNDICFNDLASCQARACEDGAKNLTCNDFAVDYVCNNGTVTCRSGGGVMMLGQNDRCALLGNHSNCVCRIGVLSMNLTKGDSRVCTIDLLLQDRADKASPYAQEGDLCDSRQCDPSKPISCQPAPNIPEYADVSPGTRVCIGVQDQVKGSLGKACQVAPDGSNNCAPGLSCLLDPNKANDGRTCVAPINVATREGDTCSNVILCAEGLRCASLDGRRQCIPSNLSVENPVVQCQNQSGAHTYCRCENLTQPNGQRYFDNEGNLVTAEACVAGNSCVAYCQAQAQGTTQSVRLGEGEEGWRPLGIGQDCHKCSAGDQRKDCPFASQETCQANSTAAGIANSTVKFNAGAICEGPDGSLNSQVCREGLICRRETTLLSLIGINQPSNLGKCLGPANATNQTVTQECTNNPSLCTEVGLTCMNDPLLPNRKICQIPSSVKKEGESCNPLVGRVGCEDGLVCTKTNQTGFTCVGPNSVEASCAARGVFYQMCNTTNAQGENIRQCLNTLNGSCAAFTSAVENNQVAPGERRWKLAVNQATCAECKVGESRDLCRYTAQPQCQSVQVALYSQSQNNQLAAGEICQAQDGTLHGEWCQSGLLCAPIAVDYGSPGPARCHQPQAVTNSTCTRVDQLGRRVPDDSLCFGAKCMYDAKRSGYVCKSPDTEIPEESRRVIAADDLDRTCHDPSGCFCATPNANGEISNTPIAQNQICPVLENQTCALPSDLGNTCGVNNTGTCVYLNDSTTLTCTTGAIDSASQSTCSERMCNCSRGNVSVNYCTFTGDSCQSACQLSTVQEQLDQKEQEQAQAVLRTLQNIGRTAENAFKGLISLYTNATKAARVSTTEQNFTDAATQFQTSNQSSNGPRLMSRGVRCESGLECQSGLCTSNSKLSREFGMGPVAGSAKVCADFSDLLQDGVEGCFNDAACKSGSCRNGICQASEYRTPQILAGQRCAQEASLGCLCRLPDGNSAHIDANQECLVPVSGTCTNQAQCGGVAVCQQVTASRSECAASQVQIITPVLEERAEEVVSTGTALLENGQTCTSGVECRGGFCTNHDGNLSTPKQCSNYAELLNEGQTCGSPGQCKSGLCQNFVCTAAEQKKIVFPGQTCDSSEGCQCRGDNETLPYSQEIGEGASCVVPEGEICTLASQCSAGFLCVQEETGRPSVCRNPARMITEERTCRESGRKFCSQCWNAYNFQVSLSATDPNVSHPGTAPAFCVDNSQACSCPNIPGGQ